MAQAEPLRISQVGLAARSPEGHAAKGMAIKGHEDLWVDIQTNTFRNWVNENLRPAGLVVSDLADDLKDGTRLCALVEALQKRPLRGWVRSPSNQHHCLENVSVALQAIEADGVKLVNIGNTDIVNGNLKLILGLIWSLIVRYQIGRSKFPPKKLMLAWLRAALPECQVNNFTTDWNSGIALSALLDYCKPGLFPHWKALNPRDGVENCRTAMHLARREFDIPMVLEPEYLASPYLDELSGMTYLSYFMKENSPGFHATLRWVNEQIPQHVVRNFTRDWNDGRVLCSLVRSLGGSVPGYNQMNSSDPDQWESNLNIGINGGKKLGVEPLLRAKDMANKEVEHLGVMAYAANFQWVRPRAKPGERVQVSVDSHHTRVNQQTTFNVEFLVDDVDPREVTAEVLGPNGNVECRLNLGPSRGTGTFTPTRVGMHKVLVYSEGEAVKGAPIHIRAMPITTTITHEGMDPCAVGSIVEVLVNSNGTSHSDVTVTATSPTGRELDCPVHETNGVHSATFQPDEAGEWTIGVMHGGQHIQGGPFTCFVFDPNGIKLENLDGAQPNAPFSFLLDASGTGGLGDIVLDIVGERKSIPHHVEHLGGSLYRVTFNTGRAGKYRIYAYFNGQDVRASPFILRVGTQRIRSRDRVRANLEEREELISPRLTASANSPFVKVSPPEGESRYNSDSFESRQNSLESQIIRTHISDNFRNGRSSSPYRSSSPRPMSPTQHLGTTTTYKTTLISPVSSPIGYRTSPRNSPSPIYSPTFRASPRASPTLHVNGVTDKHVFDKTSNVRVSSLLNNLNQRRDSWDALVKTQDYKPSSTNYESAQHNVKMADESYSSSFSHQQMTSSKSRTYNSLDTSDLTSSGRYSPSPIRDNDVPVSGEALRLVSVNRPATFVIDTSFNGQRPADLSDVVVDITAPSRRTLPVKLTRGSRKELITAHFTTSEVGEHLIDVRIRGNRLTGSPYRTHAYNSRAIQVGHIPNGILGQPVEFEIDGSGAGSGNLEILVNGGHVTSSVRTLGNQRFRASFVPHELLTHIVEMKFNGETVPGSPWKVVAMAGPKMSVLGDAVRLVAAGHPTAFELSALGFKRSDIDVHIVSPSKRPVSSRVIEEKNGLFRIEFTPTEVGSHLVEVALAGEKLSAGPLVAKVYNSSLIRVTEVGSGVVGQPCQFRVDASQAGEGQLEISINEGEVPNHVQVVGGGRCLVSFTPEQTKPHLIDIKFNGETVAGCPFVCTVSDTSRVALSLRNLELIPVDEVARFHMSVDGSGSAELAVSVRGPSSELPVKVTGNVHTGFTAEFMPHDVGAHSITVEYNGHAVTGTPFIAKAYDAKRVLVGPLPQGFVGKTFQFMVDASESGEGNLEITISARGHNIPTQVHPQGNARFAVSFVPIEATDHVISINFNKEPAPGSPFLAHVTGDSPHHITVSGPSLTSASVGKTSYFSLSNVGGTVEDIEVNVEGPSGQAVPAQVKDNGGQTFHVEFTPRVVGEHSINVIYRGVPVAGSPFSCKVSDVRAIKVKDVMLGSVGKPITFLVETSQAGPGNLEVTVNGGRVPTSAQAQGPHTYAISFTPRDATVHTVDLRFNGEDVPGSPFSCQVAQAARVVISNDGMEKVPVNRPSIFTVESDPNLAVPEVQVLSPSRRPLGVDVVPHGGGRYNVQFTPTDVGDHSVEVKINGVNVEGSPFLIKAYDAAKVKVTDINVGAVGKPVFFSINASQAGAGNLEIIVSVNGCNVPNYVQSEGNARFKVNFKPQEAAPHSLSVRFNGEPVPGSPFTCKVLDRSQILVSGLKACALGRPATITIDPQKAGGGEEGGGSGNCTVNITTPSGRVIPANINITAENKYTAIFTPEEVGRHSVSISVDGDVVRGSPFACNVYDVAKINVTGLGPCKAGKPITFTVDASSAGEGTLELVVSTKHSTVKAEVVACSRGLYDVTFVPHEPIPHFVNISFNEEDVPGSPFKCNVLEPSGKESRQVPGHRKESRVLGVRESVRGAPAHFLVDPKGLDGHIDMEVLGPDGAAVSCMATRLPSGVIRVEYRPQQVGVHTVSVYHNQVPISKQPLTVNVFDPLQAHISDLGDAFCHRAATFKVDTSSAGPGTLAVSVRAAGIDVKHSIRELHNGQYEVVFHPKLAIPHRIDVKFNGMHIAGCPVEIAVQNPAVGQDVMATGLGLYQARAGSVSSFVIETLGHPAKEFDVVITGPHATAVPVRCYQQKDGNLLAEFTANSAGVYKIDVMHGSRPVRGSPYHCQVYDASKVKIETGGSQIVSVNEKITFKLVRKQAGFAELDVTVTSPLGQDLPIKVNSSPDDKDCDLIEFSPSLPGNYRFNITYGGQEIPGSPIMYAVEEAGVVRAHGDGLNNGHVGTKATFKISSAGLSGEPQVQIDGPETVADSVIDQTNDGDFIVSYTPTEVGVFDVRITWDGTEIAGSPFHPKIVDTRKVRVIGGWEAHSDSRGRLELAVHTTKKISFDTTEAGPGLITAECVGPNGQTVPVAVETTAAGTRARLLLTPRSAGEHLLSVSYGGFLLARSPLVGMAEASGATAGPVRVVLTGRGLATAKCQQEAEFSIDGSQAGPGSPEVSITGMKADIPVQLFNLGNSVYRATYTPTVPGSYLLNVMWADRQVKGCPLKLAVTAVADASRVVCSGDGLRVGTVGKEIRSFIDTRHAGPGELTAHAVGPHKVAYCELYDHGDGTFTLNVKPQESGRHALTIKYGGEHVPGSPFTLRVNGAPDASKVRVYGPGVEHGVLATFQSRFICDTRGAGAGQLTVRIRGPKGAFRVEMQRGSQKDRTILCKFDPTEPGDYRVEVKWAGEHVPGSPFVVMIFDTQEELNRFLQGSHSPGSELYGSVAYSTGYAHINSPPSFRGSRMSCERFQYEFMSPETSTKSIPST